MSKTNMRSQVGQLRRRNYVIGGAAALFWSMTLAIAVLLVAVWLDLVWELPAKARAAVWFLAAGALVLLLAIAIYRIAQRSRDESLARLLDEAAGTGGVIFSGWELQLQATTSATRDSQLTAGLSKMAVAKADECAGQVKAGEAVPSRAVRRSAVTFALTVLGVVLLGLALPGLAQTAWARFSNPFGDIPPYSHITFEVNPGDTSVVYGQGLEIDVRVSDDSLEQVELVYLVNGQSDVLPMFPQADGGWRTTLAKVVQPSQYFIRAQNARSRRFRVDVLTTPQIESVKFRIESPAYTRNATYEGPLPKDGIVGLKGTKVTVWVTSNRPLSGGKLILKDAANEDAEHSQELQRAGWGDGQQVIVGANGDNHVRASFELAFAGRFRLTVVDQENQSSVDAFEGAMTLLEDQRPFIRLLQPRAQSLATPNVNLPIAIAAEDDFGITRLQLYRSLNDSRPLPMEMSVAKPPERRLQVREYLPLSEYGLQPGDVIKVFARVEDNDPAGAKGAESSVATVRIISQEEFELMMRKRDGLKMLASKYQQAQRRMERLASELRELEKQLKKAPPGSPAAKEIRDKMKELAEQFEREAAAIERAAKKLLPYDLDRNLTNELQKTADELREAGRALRQLQSQPNMKNSDLRKELDKLAKKLAANRKNLQKNANDPIQHLSLVFPLKKDESRFVAIYLRQVDLAERLASLENADAADPKIKARMRELEAEQRQIREDLIELLEDIETHANRLPDDEQFDALREQALAFAEAVRSSGAIEAMSDAENALANFRGGDGHKHAKLAAEILAKFLKQCNGMGKACEGCLGFSPGLSNGLGKTIEQLLAEAGFKPGSGAGTGMASGFGAGVGAGGGYSARQSTLNNVGMYGGLPALDDSSRSGMGDSVTADSPGKAGSFQQQNNDPTLFTGRPEKRASGGGRGAIPLRYRGRVGKYFQRLSEELGKDN